MEQTAMEQAGSVLWWVLLVAVLVGAVLSVFFWVKGRRLPGDHVFRASRFSRGNLLFPTQVKITPGSVLHFTPEIFGGREQSIHIAHISSVLIDRNLFFSDVLIETSGGHNPVRCHGHKKRDAVVMKDVIERFQSEFHGRPRGQEVPPPGSVRPS